MVVQLVNFTVCGNHPSDWERFDVTEVSVVPKVSVKAKIVFLRLGRQEEGSWQKL